MKKGTILLSGLLGLMLLSFAPPQQKKVVRLKKGNYLLDRLKMETNDVEALQKLAEEMYEQLDVKTGKDDQKGPRYEDLMTIYQAREGYKAYVVSWHEDDTNVFVEEVHENVFSETLYHDKGEGNKESFAGAQQRIDAIMQSYL